MLEDHAVAESQAEAKPTMTVTLLSRHKEERKTVPVMCVERLTENIRWDCGENPVCHGTPYGFACHHKAQFVVYALGAKRARLYCSNSQCLAESLKCRLPRPAGEAEQIEVKQIEEMRQRKAIADAKKQHDEAGRCEAHARTLSGHCERLPKFFVENGRDEPARLCSHHTVRYRKRTVVCRQGVGIIERPRKIEPILHAVNN